MKLTRSLITVVTFACCVTSLIASEFLPCSTPEAQGIPSAAILEFVRAAEADPDRAAHSVIIVRNGHAVAEGYWAPYAKDQPHELFSLSKSFTSTAVGLAVAEGLLGIDERVVDLFPDDVPDAASARLKNMRVRQLLTMSTGHRVEPKIFVPMEGEKTLVQRFLEADPELDPGRYFLYNTAATYMQAAIVQKLSGQRVRDYLMPRLFGPLGIDKPEWDQSPEGIDLGGFGLYLKTRDIAKFGQLLLQKGNWEGKQIIPQDWLAMANSKQVSNGASPESDWHNGYGFQFWMNASEGFRGDGAFGQLCVVLPKANMVVAMTAATRNIQEELRWIWNILLPSLSQDPLPENPPEQAELQAKLASLVIAMPTGNAQPDKDTVAGTGTCVFEENVLGYKTLYPGFDGDKLVIDMDTVTGSYSIPVGAGIWLETDFMRPTRYGPPEKSRAFVSGAWEAPTVLNLSCVFEGRCQMLRLRISFGEQVVIEPSANVSFGRLEVPVITGAR